ncbi:MAG: prenyltransferase, partial [Chitinophagaceae bacterium]|nr:prenyltransferase [Chitinophagaceae bacterium]
GTFIFTGIIYILAVCALGIYLINKQEEKNFFIIQLFFIPVVVYFIWWLKKVFENNSAANYKNTMQMNILASICSNIAFITLLIL